MTDSIDPSQVNSTRSEENTSVKNENDSAEVEEDNGNKLINRIKLNIKI